MTETVRVHLLPPEGGLAEGRQTAVIVDVLRASTTVTAALAAGAASVIPCVDIDDARQAAAENSALLGGERLGLKLPGFDLGNSPREYTAAAVGGRIVAFTTTNGTRALHRSLAASDILIGSFVNISAVAAACEESGRRTEVVCAGTDGAVTAEDVLFAGMLAFRLIESGRFQPADDVTRIAMDFWRHTTENPTRLLQAVRESTGGRNLERLGFEADIEFAAAVDRFGNVPVWQPHTQRIV